MLKLIKKQLDSILPSQSMTLDGYIPLQHFGSLLSERLVEGFFGMVKILDN